MGQSHSDEEVTEPEPGDLVVFRRPLYDHYGVAVDKDHVVHLTSTEPELPVSNFSSTTGPKAEVKKERLSDVAGKNNYRVNKTYDRKRNPKPQEEIIRDAKSMVGKKKNYNLFNNNCEHFATTLRYGVPDSKQVDDGITIGSAALGAAVGLAVLIGATVVIAKAVGRRENEDKQILSQERKGSNGCRTEDPHMIIISPLCLLHNSILVLCLQV